MPAQMLKRCPVIPVGHKIILELEFDPKHNLKSSIIEIPAETLETHLAACREGTVLGIGPTAFRSLAGFQEGDEPWCKLDDRVGIKLWAGDNRMIGNKAYRIIDDRDVTCIISREGFNHE